jgi:prophage regulatory protein
MSKIFGRANAPKAPTVRMLSYDDLPGKGIRYHPNYLRRLWEDDRFPKPVKLSPRKLAWPEKAIDDWIAEKIKQAEC